MIIIYSSSVAADAPAIYIAGQQVPYSKSVKDLGLVLDTAFSCVEKTLEHCITITRWKLALFLVVPLFIYCDVVYSKISAALRHKWYSITGARYVYGVSRRDHISDYANFLLGMPLGKFFSFRICCQMYNIISRGEPGYLYDSIQFGRSRRLGGVIIPRHNCATTAASFFVRGAILWNDLLTADVSKRGAWRWEVQGKVSFVHGADSKQLIFLILLKLFMVGWHWVLC
jgi:hypothetical protein